MKRRPTKVLSFRVPIDVAEKVDNLVAKAPLGGRQRLIESIFVPALNRFERKQSKISESRTASA